MISIVDNKDFIMTKIVDVVRNNSKISQKGKSIVVTLVFDAYKMSQLQQNQKGGNPI